MEEHKKYLKTELENLVNELNMIAVQDQKTKDWVARPEKVTGEADSNVTADNTEDWNERRALMGQLETRYHNVLIALDKFESNSFGICEVCNEMIEPDRLDANKAARTCKMHLEKERELPF